MKIAELKQLIREELHDYENSTTIILRKIHDFEAHTSSNLFKIFKEVNSFTHDNYKLEYKRVKDAFIIAADEFVIKSEEIVKSYNEKNR